MDEEPEDRDRPLVAARKSTLPPARWNTLKKDRRRRAYVRIEGHLAQ